MKQTISRLHGALDLVEYKDTRPSFQPCHSQVQLHEMQNSFNSDRRTVFVATNIAETSLTIPRIKHVVDGGHVKRTFFNAETMVTNLDVVEEAKSESTQRRGRTGRLSDGHFYLCMTKEK